jgi:peptide chain release factor 1
LKNSIKDLLKRLRLRRKGKGNKNFALGKNLVSLILLRNKMEEIESLKKEYDELLKQLSSPELLSDWEKFLELSKRKNFLEKIFEKEKEIQENLDKIKENSAIILANEDPELISLAETESSQLKEAETKLQSELEGLLKNGPEDEDKANGKTESDMAAIMEIRAGTGGKEAGLFAGDLYKMYSRYAQNQGWKVKVLDSSSTELGGFKEIIFEIKNGPVFEKMKYEGGVHRVQRIPETEKAGRVHTSTASVAVLPKPKKTTLNIRSDDIKIDFYCSSGPGGQYVNKRHTAVRLTHLPTGVIVTSQTERDQFQNKTNAMAILEARLLERQTESENEKMSDKRNSQIGQAKRVEKIRTYNFPQDRLTDHRIKKSWHNLEKIMNGEINQVIDDLQEGLKENSAD